MKLEEVMSQAAYSQITEAMPAIQSYLLGFEVINADEETNRGLGVLLAKIGDSYIFIPSIYRNGQICDMDMLYDPANNRFLPAQDNTISYLLSKKTDIVGDNVPKPSVSVGGHTGGAGGVSLNLPFSMFTKVASAGKIPHMLKMASGMMAELLLNAHGSFDNIYKALDDLSAPSLSKLASGPMSEALLHRLDTPDGYNTFIQWYNEADMDKLVKTLADNAAISRVRRESAASEPAREAVKILTSASTEARDLSDEEKASILRDGAIIVDNRGLIPSKVYKTKQNSDWQAPSENGLYELLKLDGSTVTAYVININAAKGLDKFTATHEDFAVIPVDDGDSRVIHRIDFAPLGQFYPMDMSVPLGGTSIESITRETFKTYGEFIVVTPKGEALMLTGLYGNGDNAHWLHTDEDKFVGLKLRPYMLDKYDGVGRITDTDSSEAWLKSTIEAKLSPMPMTSSGKEMISQIVIGKPTSRMQLRGNTLRVPEGSKIYDFKDYNDLTNDLGLVDQANALCAIAERDRLVGVTIYSADGLVKLSDSMMTKTASGSMFDVAKVLVSDYAVAPKEAVKLVKEASAKQGGESYLIKIADDTGFKMAFAQEEPASLDYQETQTLSPMTTEKVKDREILERASQAGVRQVLDVELLKLLAEDDSSVREVRSYIPKLLGAVDALGRLLFLTRVNESLHETYGDQRTIVMEKSIKSAFVKLWDIILSLQQGKVDTLSDLLGGDLAQSIG